MAFVRELTPEILTGQQAAEIVQDLALIEKAAATGRMFAAVRVAQTDAWKGLGHASAADWLAAQCGISVSKAAAQLRTAKAAKNLPKTKKAMDEGELSPDQADAVAGAASVDPDSEDELLDSAGKDTASELRRKADARKAAATDAATRERRIRKERSLRFRNDADGAFCLNLRGPAVDGARLLAMLRPYQEAAFKLGLKNHVDGARDTYDNRNYDAFCAMLAHLTQQARTANNTPNAANTSPRRPSPDGPAPGRPAPRGTTKRGPAPTSATQSNATRSGTSQGTSSSAGTSPSGASPYGANSALLRARADAKARAARDKANATNPTPDPSPDGETSPVAGHPPNSGTSPSSATASTTGHPPGTGVRPDSPPDIPPDTPPDIPPDGSPSGADLLPEGWPSANSFKPPGGNNTKVIIRIDHDALLRGHTQSGETCEIDGVGPIPVSAVKDLILNDDPFIAAVTTKGIDIQKVVHLGRGLNAHQRTAIEAMGLRCSNIACNKTIAVQIDHRDPWADNQETVLANQDPLCPECHRHKTHHGWHLEPGTGPRKFLPPDPPHPPESVSQVPGETSNEDQLLLC